MRTAILNGFSPNRILWRHVLPNAGAVIVNVIALNAIFLLSGVIVIENVFAYPGIGTLMVQAIQAKDLPIVEAVAVVTAAILVTVNLIADGLVLLAVPRLRTRETGGTLMAAATSPPGRRALGPLAAGAARRSRRASWGSCCW